MVLSLERLRRLRRSRSGRGTPWARGESLVTRTFRPGPGPFELGCELLVTRMERLRSEEEAMMESFGNEGLLGCSFSWIWAPDL
ncbi:hypothetical protein FF1_012860 [Malus domestica]